VQRQLQSLSRPTTTDASNTPKNDISGKEYWGRFASDTNTHLDDDTLEKLLLWDIEIWSHLEEPLLSWTRSLRVAGF